MAIGFSVDYTVHLGTIYAYSKSESCVDKVTHFPCDLI